MAQSPKLNRISVGISDKEYAELQALSEKYRISMAWLGRQAISEFLDKYKNQELQLPLSIPQSGRRKANG